MRYIIHSCPMRQWYVDDFLIPSMLEQGISQNEIIVHCDTEGKGNLQSCMESFQWCGEHDENGSWHIQDDVVLCHAFAERTRQYNEGVVCGEVITDWGPDSKKFGMQPVRELWYSFQCIRIPDQLAGECAKWFFEDASKRRNPEYRNRVARKKHDDDFFRFFLLEKYKTMQILNLNPCIVDHVDYLIGGSLINQDRKKSVNRAVYWEDESIVKDLEEQIKTYRESRGL